MTTGKKILLERKFISFTKLETFFSFWWIFVTNFYFVYLCLSAFPLFLFYSTQFDFLFFHYHRICIMFINNVFDGIIRAIDQRATEREKWNGRKYNQRKWINCLYSNWCRFCNDIHSHICISINNTNNRRTNIFSSLHSFLYCSFVYFPFIFVFDFLSLLHIPLFFPLDGCLFGIFFFFFFHTLINDELDIVNIRRKEVNKWSINSCSLTSTVSSTASSLDSLKWHWYDSFAPPKSTKEKRTRKKKKIWIKMICIFCEMCAISPFRSTRIFSFRFASMSSSFLASRQSINEQSLTNTAEFLLSFYWVFVSNCYATYTLIYP